MLVVGYVRAESGTRNIPLDIMLLCCNFFGDFSHLIGRLEPTRAVKEGMWYIDEMMKPHSTRQGKRYNTTGGFAAQVKHLKRCKTGKHGHVKYMHEMVMPHRGETLKGMLRKTKFRQAIVSTREYKFVDLKYGGLNEGLAVLKIGDSLTMEVPVSFYQDNRCLRKLYSLRFPVLLPGQPLPSPTAIMMTVLSGPKWSEDKVELVQCVVDVRAANTP